MRYSKQRTEVYEAIHQLLLEKGYFNMYQLRMKTVDSSKNIKKLIQELVRLGFLKVEKPTKHRFIFRCN